MIFNRTRPGKLGQKPTNLATKKQPKPSQQQRIPGSQMPPPSSGGWLLCGGTCTIKQNKTRETRGDPRHLLYLEVGCCVDQSQANSNESRDPRCLLWRLIVVWWYMHYTKQNKNRETRWPQTPLSGGWLLCGGICTVTQTQDINRNPGNSKGDNFTLCPTLFTKQLTAHKGRKTRETKKGPVAWNPGSWDTKKPSIWKPRRWEGAAPRNPGCWDMLVLERNRGKSWDQGDK
jgi:hypothetical protein